MMMMMMMMMMMSSATQDQPAPTQRLAEDIVLDGGFSRCQNQYCK